MLTQHANAYCGAPVWPALADAPSLLQPLVSPSPLLLSILQGFALSAVCSQHDMIVPFLLKTFAQT